jgi:hypothetical protein
LKEIEKIFSKKSGAFFLLNGYAAGYSATSFMQATADVFPAAKGLPSEALAKEGEFGELQIEETKSDRVIPSGIYVRFVR